MSSAAAPPTRARRPPPLTLGGDSPAAVAGGDSAPPPLQLVDGTPPVTPSDGGSLGRLFDALTPLTRKVSKLPMAERLAAFELGSRLAASAASSADPLAIYAAGVFAADGQRALRRALCIRGDSCDAAASPAAAAALAASDAAAAAAATASGRWSDAAWSASAGTGSLCVLGGAGDDEDDTATSSGGAAGGPAWSRSPTRGHGGGGGGGGSGRALWRSLQASLKLSAGGPPLSAASPDKAGLRHPGGRGGSRRRLGGGGGGGLIRSGSMAAAAAAAESTPPRHPSSGTAHPAALAARAAAVLSLAAPARAEPVAWLWLLVEANAAAVAAGAVALPGGGGGGPGAPGAGGAAARVLASTSLSSWPAGGGWAGAPAAGPPSCAAPTVDSTAPLLYLARVVRRLEPEEGWLRLSAAALAPALSALRSAGGAAAPPPPAVERALAAVAPRAMAVAEDGVRRHRSLRSGRRDNAATLAAAARLLALLSACGPECGAGDACAGPPAPPSASGFGEVLAGLVAEGMAARYAALAAATGVAGGAGGGGGEPPGAAAAPAAKRAAGLADLMDGLATDLADDAEVYGPALPPWTGLDLPTVTARAALAALKRDVAAFRALPLTPAVGGAAPRAAVAAAALHARASRHAPGAADAALLPGGQPAFRPAVEAWLGGVGAKLAAASARLLAAEDWGGDGGGGGGGPSRSLVDFFSALCAVAEGEAALARSHRSHAGALERTLAAAVATHAAGLASVAEGALGGRLPGRGSGGSGGGGAAAAVARVKAAALAARRGGSAASTPADPLAPPRRLMGALADLRACGARTADVGSSLRSAVPRAWWGEAWDAAAAGEPAARLGDGLRAVRAECASRLAALCADAGRAAAAALRQNVAAALDAETAAAAAAGPGHASSARPAGPLGPADAAAAAAQRALRSRVRGWGDAAAGGGSADARVAQRVGLEAWAALAEGLQSRALGGVPPPSVTGPLGSGAAGAAVPPTLLPRAVGGLRVLASLEAAFLMDSAFGLAATDVPPAAAKARRAFTDTLQAGGWA